MKISEMTNDQATEAMIRISTPIANICDDREFLDLIDGISKLEEGTNIVTLIGKYLPKLITCAFKKHRDDLFEIVGALTMKSAAAVGKMNFKETIQTVRDSYDEILSGFFTRNGSSANGNGKG